MGNTSSNVTTGIKAQAAAEGEGPMVYKLVDLMGGGELVELAKKASNTKDFSLVDEKILEIVPKYLYNNGEGKKIPIREITSNRSKQRQNKVVVKPKDVPGQDEEIGQQKEEFKELCWNMDDRGAVGETILHLCLLSNSSVHIDLAKRLLRHFPKLINDVYLSEEYYGESVLHMAIVNEDPAMVKFLLDHGVDPSQRCCGNFFTPEDQKSSRYDTPDQEWVNVSVKTNYQGYMYMGEFPLSFAGCLAQEECIRLLVAKGADPNSQDANGNTPLHMLVIHDKRDMFDLIHMLGGRLDIKNRQGLTPLTLAATLAKKETFEHILQKVREVYWVYGNVVCAAYPLDEVDTISNLGETNEKSALNLIVHGDSVDHLELMDGLLVDLLNAKWKTFIKSRFLRRMVAFLVFFCIFVAAFLIRFGRDVYPTIIYSIVTINATSLQNVTSGANVTDLSSVISIVNSTNLQNITSLVNSTSSDAIENQCFLSRVRGPLDVARFILEAITLGGALISLGMAAQEMWIQKLRLFFITLRVDPARFLFLFSCSLIVLMVPGRIFCYPDLENVLGVFAILTMAPYLLFFCRGFKFVGPFVVMIYDMIKADLLKFFTIYIIFLMGFSQAMYIVYRNYDQPTVFNDPFESMLGLFIFSLGTFADTYDTFKDTTHEYSATIIFVLYMILVTLLMLNMLIAMMEHTYSSVNEIKKEWLRQWASILLVVEQSASKADRLQQRTKYSKPMTNGSRGLVIRTLQSESMQEEMDEERQQQNRQLMLAMMRKRTRKDPEVDEELLQL